MGNAWKFFGDRGLVKRRAHSGVELVEAPQKIDQAALLGVGISASGGAWELLETMIGRVLFLVVGSFYDGSVARSRPDWFMLKYAVSGALWICR